MSTLGEVAESMKNGIYKPASAYSEDGVACLRMYNIEDGAVVWRDVKRMKLSPGEIEEYALHPGDLLVNRVNSRELVGKTALVQLGLGACVFESKNIRVRLRRDMVFPAFVNHALRYSGRNHFSDNAQQVVGMASISQPQVGAFPLALPPLAEQRRIVARLEALEARSRRARAALDEVPALLAQARQSLLAAAFRGDLTKDWRKSKRTMASPTQAHVRVPHSLPRSWHWTTLSHHASVTGGLTKNPQRTECAQRRPYLRVANVYANRLDLSVVAEIGVSESEVEKVLLQKGDLLVVEGNGSPDQIGRVALWDGSVPGRLHQNHIIKARCSRAVLPQIPLFWLLSPGGRGCIESISKSSSGLYTLSVSKVAALPVPIPPLAEQREIVRRLESALARLDAAAAAHAAAVAELDRLDQSLLARAFRGQLVPQDPNDEPASAVAAHEN